MPFNQGLYYQIFEPVKKPSKNKLDIIFVHGMGGDSNALIPLISELHNHNPEHNIIAYDLRGGGLSTKKIPAEAKNLISVHANDLYNLCTNLNIKNPILIGHCFGGMVVQEYSNQKFSITPRQSIIVNSSLHLPFSFIASEFWLKILRFYHSKTDIKPKKRTIEQYLNFAQSHDYSLFRIMGDAINLGGITSFCLFYLSFLGWKNSSPSNINKPENIFIYGKKDVVLPLFFQKKHFPKIDKCKKIIIDSNHISPLSDFKKLAKIISQEVK